MRRLRAALLQWSRTTARRFFWRDESITPFAVLVCEILLAKTRAEVAEPVALELLCRYPDAASLVGASPRSLESLLYPLGLYRKRAKHLRACAAALVEQHDGSVPESVEALLELPFVGRYAANAVACVAFGQRRAVIDANVSRIYGRVFSLPPPPERLSNAHDLWTLAERLLPRRRFKEFNWAVLDLGGTVCVAKNPACDRCPIAAQCDLRSRTIAPAKLLRAVKRSTAAADGTRSGSPADASRPPLAA